MENMKNLQKQIEKRKKELGEVINASENLSCPDILEMSRQIDELLNNYYKFLGYLSEVRPFDNKKEKVSKQT